MHWTWSALLAVCLALPAQVAVAARPAPELPTVYLALGDSVAAGVGASVPQRTGNVARIHRALPAAGPMGIDRLINLAQSGESSVSMRTGGQLARAVAAIADPATDVRLVTLIIGANDFLPLLQTEACTDPFGASCQQAVGVALATLAQNYPAILQSIRQALDAQPGDERLLVMAYYNPFSGLGNALDRAVDAAQLGSDGVVDCAANATDPTRVGLNDIITCIGRLYGAEVVDVHPLFRGQAPSLTHITDTPPDIHPNDAGHAVIAAAFLRRWAAGT